MWIRRTMVLNGLLTKFNSLEINFAQKRLVRNIPSRENAAARETMQRHNTKYTLWPMARNSNASSEDKVIANFRLIAAATMNEGLSVNSKAFSANYVQLIASCQKYDASQLIEILDALAQCNVNQINLRDDKYISTLRDTLSAAMESQIRHWSIDQLLLACDMWYHISYGNRTRFVREACKVFTKKANDMTAQQMIQALFYLNWCRCAVPTVKNFEPQLLQHFDELDLDELAIAAMGFFKTNATLTDSMIIRRLYEKLLDIDLRAVSELTLTSLLKVRHSNSQAESRTKIDLFSFLDRFCACPAVGTSTIDTTMRYRRDYIGMLRINRCWLPCISLCLERCCTSLIRIC